MIRIIITGVSRGIGRALTGFFLSQSHMEVYGISRHQEALHDLKNCITAPGTTFVPVHLSLANPESYPALVHILKERGGQADILINNAGAMLHAPFEETSSDQFDEIININLKAPYFLIQKLLPHFSKNAHIVNITSMGGVLGTVKFPGLSLYSAAKGGLSILTEVLAEELKEHSIVVNALALGAVQTEMLHEAFPGYKAPIEPETMAKYIGTFALEGNRFYNGKVLPVSTSTP